MQIKKITFYIVFLVSLGVSFSSFSEIVSIRADNWYPINGISGSDKPGYMIEIAQAIFSKHGHTIDYKEMPWERSLDMVREGKFDCVVGASHTDAKDFVFPTLSMGKLAVNFYVKQGDPWQFQTISSLEERLLGVISGYSYGEKLDAYITKYQTSADKISALGGNNALEQNIKKLLSGRLNTLAENQMVMEAKLSQLGEKGLIDAGTLGDPVDIYIACTPNKPTSQQYIDLINSEFPILRSNGQLKAILDKYGLKDWE